MAAANIALPKLGLDVVSMNIRNQTNIGFKHMKLSRLQKLNQLQFFNLSSVSGSTLINAPKAATPNVVHSAYRVYLYFIDMRELKLNKKQFSIFNDYDQFQIFTDDEGFANYENLNTEFDKLFKKFDIVIINEDDYIYGEKNGARELIMPHAYEAFSIALAVLNDES